MKDEGSPVPSFPSSIPHSLLERCPFCDYRLEGLPVQHLCPECGRAVNRNWRQFGGVAKWHCLSVWARWTHALVHGLAAMLFIALFLRFCRTWRGGLNLVSFGIGGFLLMAASGAAQKIRLMFVRPPYLVLVAPTAVHVVDHLNQHFETCALSEIDRAFVDALQNVCLVMGGKTVRLVRFHKGKVEAKRCAEYINGLVDNSGESG